MLSTNCQRLFVGCMVAGLLAGAQLLASEPPQNGDFVAQLRQEVSELIRQLDVGQAVFSSAISNAPRLVVGIVRPRVVAHGGEGF